MQEQINALTKKLTALLSDADARLLLRNCFHTHSVFDYNVLNGIQQAIDRDDTKHIKTWMPHVFTNHRRVPVLEEGVEFLQQILKDAQAIRDVREMISTISCHSPLFSDKLNDFCRKHNLNLSSLRHYDRMYPNVVTDRMNDIQNLHRLNRELLHELHTLLTADPQ